jgi:hypothetical protein
MDYGWTVRVGADGITPSEIDPHSAAVAVSHLAHFLDEFSKSMESVLGTIEAFHPVLLGFQESVADAVRTFDYIYERLPLNWPAGEAARFYAILDEGVPLVYIPRRETVLALMEASDYDDRMTVLKDRKAEVIADCRSALDEQPLHASVENLSPLVAEALTCLESDQYASAQAQAVCVCDTMLHRYAKTRRYKKIIATIESTDLDGAYYQGLYRFALALRPTVTFLAEWDSLSETPAPHRLSRHATVHGISPEHLTEGNAVIAIMLASSVLLGMSEWNRLSDKLARDTSS